jgi:hypothetical protein
MSQRILRAVPSALLMTTALAWNLPVRAAVAAGAAPAMRPAATQKHGADGTDRSPADQARASWAGVQTGSKPVKRLP